MYDSIDNEVVMIDWQTNWKDISKIAGWDLARQPLDNYVNWYWDCVAHTFLNIWFIPFRMPELHSDVDKFVSQFSLNGIKATNICRPS